MGEVYAAIHELMQREAVIKILLPEMSLNQTMVKRFFHEAQAAAQIQHPGIVEVFDFGYAEDGRAYIIMELLLGETLNDRLGRMGPLPVEQAVVLIRQLAGAVGAAHERGIVHRDLKPDNIFIVPDPEVPGGERVKVLDFGLAKLAVQNGMSLATMSGAVFGTPAYMAPEQCTDAGRVDHRADLYSIGCIFYKCLCGRPPFGTGGLEVLAAQLRDPVTPPRQLRAAISPELEAVVLQLLQKAPDARFQSCAALIQALDRPLLARAVQVVALSEPATLLSHGVPSPGRITQGASEAARSGQARIRASSQAGDHANQQANHQALLNSMRPTELIRVPAEAHKLAAAVTVRQPVITVGAGLQPEQPPPGPAPAQNDPFRPFLDESGDKEPWHRHSSLIGSAGELYRPAPSQPSMAKGRRRWWTATAGMAAIGAIAAVLLAVQDEPETSAADQLDPAPALVEAFDAHLAQAEAALEARQWSAARDAIDGAARLDLGDPGREERAAALQARAQAESQNQLAFERFRTAVATKEIDAIIRHYDSIPEDSVYRAEATPAYKALLHQWQDEILGEAQHLASKRACDELDTLIANNPRIVSEAQPEFEGLAEKCVEAASRPEKPAERAPKPRPNEAGTTASADAKPQTMDAQATDVRSLIDQVRRDYKAGRYAKALRNCEQVLQQASDNLDVTALCGLAACNLGDAAQAKRYLAKVPASQKGHIVQTCFKRGINVGAPSKP